MAAPKFTSGPWLPGHMVDDTSSCNCRYVLAESYCGAVCTVEIDNGLRVGDGGNDAPPLEEAKANAHLIAAAPELFYALVEVLQIARRNEAGPFIERADAAIAKALGK